MLRWIIKTTGCIQNKVISPKLMTNGKQKDMVWGICNQSWMIGNDYLRFTVMDDKLTKN